MRSLYRHRLVLTLTGPILIALGLPLIVPFAATLLGETMHLQMRLSLPESLLATLGILVAWFVISRTIDVVLSGSDVGGRLTGRLVSAGASMLVLGGGYLLITGSIPLAAITAVVISGLFFALNTMLDVRAMRPTDSADSADRAQVLVAGVASSPSDFEPESHSKRTME